MSLRPLIQSLFLVDNGTRDEETGKVILSGIFDLIEIPFGATHYTEGCFVFFALREIRVATRLKLTFTDLADMTVLLSRDFTLEANDPLQTTDMAIAANRIPIPHSGVYVWELWYNDDLLGSMRITASVQGRRPTK